MRRRATFVPLAVITLAVAAGALFGDTILERGGGRASARVSQPVEVAAEAALTGTASASDVPALERAVETSPRDERSLTLLGYAYLQRWRETADASYLPRAEEALGRARRLTPDDPLVVTGLGSLALTQHEFRQALDLGRRAQALAPYSARPYGIVGDALVELGRYDSAFAAFERMNSLKPSVASYARIGYARELLGDVDGAVAAMRLAVDAASGQREPGAWTRVELAKLELQRGRSATARRLLRQALTLMPGYVPANEQLARVEFAQGRIRQAIARARVASDAVPMPQVVALLGDLLDRAGDRAAANRQTATVGAIDRILAANGVRTDLEAAIFDVDHLRRRATLVVRARAARAARPSIYGDDALAWALARTGSCEEALPWSTRSLRLGTRDAQLAFHRAWIERCVGHQDEAARWARRALAWHPTFSVRWLPEARRLSAIRGARS